MRSVKVLERFLRHVKMTPSCWVWVGGKRGNRRADHGSFRVGSMKNGSRRTVYPHRWIYELFHGRIPEGMQINHQCDVMRCVNPAHMRLGTQQENVEEMYARGRRAR